MKANRKCKILRLALVVLFTMPAVSQLFPRAGWTTDIAYEIPTIPVHVALISSKPEAINAFTDENIQWISESLNEEFKDGSGNILARFELKAVTQLSDVKTIAPESLGYEGETDLRKLLRELSQSPLFHKDKLNIFVYNNTKEKGVSKGGFHCRWRMWWWTKKGKKEEKKEEECYSSVLLQWETLQARKKEVLLHEIGHAFTLGHIAHPKDKNACGSNVMVTGIKPLPGKEPPPLPEGECGYYFTPSQVKKIKDYMEKLLQTFQLIQAKNLAK